MTQPTYQRHLRNFLLDAPFQLKFAGYFVAVTLVIAALLGAFLWHTTSRLFSKMDSAVEARSKAAENSRELGACSLNNDLAKSMDDPALAAKLEERSKEIDAKYEAEKQAVLVEKSELVAQQRFTLYALIGGLLAFIVLIAVAAILITHRIVGPLLRIKRMAREVGEGVIRPPSYGLRPGDELQDVFEAMSGMVTSLRRTVESDLAKVDAALSGDRAQLDQLKGSLSGRLAPGEPPRR
jgi:methyl-accepting chemotaxis protein